MTNILQRTKNAVLILIILGISAGLATSFSFAVCTVAATFTHYFPLNVKAFGAVGNNVVDDTVAIQAAIDAAVVGGTVFFPPGTYKVSAPLAINGKRIILRGDSNLDAGSRLEGSVNGAIIDNTPVSGSNTGGAIEKLTLKNTHVSGIGIHWIKFTSGVIREVNIQAFIGIQTENDSVTLLIEQVSARTLPGSPIGSIGMIVGGHTTIISSDIVGFDEGIRASGTTVNITGCRLEVNRTGMVLGRDFTGATLALSRSVIAGNSMEANDVGINVVSLTHSQITGLAINGSINSPSSQSVSGLVVVGTSDVLLQNVVATGSFSSAAIQVSGSHSRLRFAHASASNTFSGGKLWNVLVPLSAVDFERTNYVPRQDGTAAPAVVNEFLTTRALAGVNHLEPIVAGKNLRGKNVVVGSGLTSLAIVFQMDRSSGNAPIDVATPGAGAGTLAAGTYYYIATLVTEMGESGAINEKTVVVGGANNQVAMTFSGVPGALGWKRRIYRGTAPGVYNGYFETALNAATFTDTGTVFTGLKSHPVGAAETSMIETDANYAVIVTPAWNTSVWVTSKATTGFTINFGTAPGSPSALDWFIVR